MGSTCLVLVLLDSRKEKKKYPEKLFELVFHFLPEGFLCVLDNEKLSGKKGKKNNKTKRMLFFSRLKMENFSTLGNKLFTLF